MKPALLTALLIVLPSFASAQERETFTAAAARHARALANVTPVQRARNQSWNRVRDLTVGSLVRVVLEDGTTKTGELGYVGEDRIVLLSLASLPGDARRRLLDVAKNHPGYIGEEPHFIHKELRVDRTNIYFKDAPVAGTAAVMTELRRDSIAEVSRKPRGSLMGGLLGTGIGTAASALVVLNTLYEPCDATGCALIGGAILSLPIVGGVIGAKAFPRPEWKTVYRGR
jgi:hypothetical protein